MSITADELERVIRTSRCRRCMGMGTPLNPLREDGAVQYGNVQIVPPTKVHEKPCG